MQVKVETHVRTERTALLPYVFFEEGSSEIPNRYPRPSVERPNEDPLRTYRRILDIIGKRMRLHPEERLTLVGTTSNNGVERGANSLATARAEAVKSYLVSSWKLDAARIATEGRALPERPSNNIHPAGEAENRRVEIVGSQKIIGPVVRADTVLQSFDSPGLRYASTIDAEAGLGSWAITAKIGGTVSRKLSGQLLEHSRLSDQLTVSEMQRLANNERLTYSLSVVDRAGTQFTTGEQELGVEVNRVVIEAPFTSDSLSSLGHAIYFDYNSSQLHPDARAAIAEAKRLIPAGARIVVTGYADETGDRDYNRRLSLARARAVASELNGYQVEAGVSVDEVPLYPNDTPEGRFYSRTARIIVLNDE